MRNDDTKERLILATIKLLETSADPAQITARQICAAAQTNLAMINYCFKSKEELMNIAVQRMISEQAKSFAVSDEGSPKEQLRSMLYHLCDTTVQYDRFSRVSVPFILLQEEISHPLEILPYLKKYFAGQKNETECRVIAYQIVAFMQLVFLRADEFFKYSGINIRDTAERHAFIDMQLNLFLGDENDER
ncbi:TetR/AcrR family transcriptional regulator [Paenibacillus phocaensis]|uniref:TetR/AcrR family transcriptional regulator n=1 Tax=Paenibacillus phocaensis TaxID=1776378 RepID=UPI0003A49221|nr:TetR/AcrR family transcriptional regulator [Paenibacillus phocaensis]